MKLLDKYLFLSILKKSIFSLFALVLIFIFFKFLDELSDIGSNGYTLSKALQYLLLLLPSIFNSLLVISIMIGTVLALGQLNSQKELQIFLTGAISIKNLIFKSLSYPVIICVFLIIFFEFISPRSIELANQVKSSPLKNILVKSDENIWFKKDNHFIHFYKNPNENYSVRVYEVTNKSKLANILYKNSYDKSNLGINNSTFSKINIDDKSSFFKIKDVSNENLTLNLDIRKQHFFNRDVEVLSIFELVQSVSYSIANNLNFNKYITELLNRLIKPITLIGMILIAIPYVINFQREASIGNRIFIAITIGVSTHLLTKITSSLALKMDLIAMIGPILPTAVLLSLGYILIFLNNHRK